MKPETSHIVINTDARTWLKEANLNDMQIDCIITDPPYWTLDKWRNIGTTTRLGGHKDASKQREDMWFPTIDYDDMYNVMIDMIELLANNSLMYVFCDHEVVAHILNWVREDDHFDSVRYSKPLIWDKIDNGMGYHWRARHEYIVMLEKGRRQLNDLSLPDVLQYKRVQGKHYPTEKPVELIKTLIRNSTCEGETVLDPFCGSGVVAVACKELVRHSVSLDIQPKAVEWTRNRLGQAMPLFAEEK